MSKTTYDEAMENSPTAKAREKVTGIPESERKKGRHVTLREIGIMLGVADGRISRLGKEDGFPESTKGKSGARMIWTAEFIRWYAQREANAKIREIMPEGEDLSDRPIEELRLIKARRMKVEVEKARMSGTLVPVDLVREVMDSIAVMFCSSIESVSGRLANDLASIDNPAEVRETLLGEMRRIRQSVAKGCAEFTTTN